MQTKNSNFGTFLALAPIVCLLITGAAAFIQYRKVTALRADIVTADAQIAVVDQKLKEIQLTPPTSRVAAVPLSTHEQPMFVNWLRETATASRVEMTKWTNMPAPPPPPQSTTAAADQPKDPNAPKPLPRGYLALVSAVEVSGKYGDIRDFLYLLLRSERVVTLNGVKWHRGEKWPKTKVSFTLTRYVNTEPIATHGGAN